MRWLHHSERELDKMRKQRDAFADEAQQRVADMLELQV